MPYTMQLVASGGSSVTIPLPEYGYEVQIHLPIHTAERHPYGYTLFDAGSTYDYRTVSINTTLMPVASQTALNAFLRNEAKGRGENITLRLGATPTGFYAFGPDLGDVGDFTCRLINQQQGGVLYSPYKYISGSLDLVLVTAPAYVLPAEVDQGAFEIGDVDGLMPPQRDTAAESLYNIRNDITRDGTPYSVDGMATGDTYETTLDLILNTSKAGALIDYLISTNGRASDIDVVADGGYIFGADNDSSGTYTAKSLGSEHTGNEVIYKISHETADRFTMPVLFLLVLNNNVEDSGEIIMEVGSFESTYSIEG